MPELLDVVELIVDVPDRRLHAGMQGTIMHCHTGDSYEVEFSGEDGETLDFLALRSEQFIVIWRARTKEWVPVVERIAALTARLPEGVEEEVLDFARFLHVRKRRDSDPNKVPGGVGSGRS